MRNFFKKTELPAVELLIQTLMQANDYLHPEWAKEEVIFNSLHAVRSCKSHKQLANYVNDVCKQAVTKLEEVMQLEQQLANN